MLGGKLILTIGLPFAAGVSLKQFAGVLAHEFGHFSQGAGMRLYALIMRINLWFARVVYQRDEWDETLEAWSSDDHGFIIILAAVTRLAVWLTRRVLWVLMQVGHMVSGFLSRQMEFDADRYEARMVGAACFAETMWRFRLMSLAESGAFADVELELAAAAAAGRLPQAGHGEYPAGPRRRSSRPSARTWRRPPAGCSTPIPATRTGSPAPAARRPATGIFHLDGPATDVFGDFDALAKAASFDMYRSSLGSGIGRDQLYEVAELVETQAAAQEGVVAAGRFFLGALGPGPTAADAERIPRGPRRPVGRQAIAGRGARRSRRPACDYLASSRRADDLVNQPVRAELAIVLLKGASRSRRPTST